MTIHDEIKSSENVIYDDEEILVVLDVDPISKGHVIILPQQRFVDIDELPNRILMKIFWCCSVLHKGRRAKVCSKGMFNYAERRWF